MKTQIKTFQLSPELSVSIFIGDNLDARQRAHNTYVIDTWPEILEQL